LHPFKLRLSNFYSFRIKQLNYMGGKNITILKGKLFLLMSLFSGAAQAASVTASPQGPLPGVLVESSAIDFTGGSHFWSLDDSGAPAIHKIASDGSFVKTVTITNAANRNWEDLTHDIDRNYMFIGDFGNNNCDRTNLRVYRIAYPSSATGSTTTAEVINFSYPDQNRFPSRWMNFDSEAFFHFQGKLYIFTKADGSAIGYTKMYSIPDSPGTYMACLVDSFYTNDRTTSADISPDGKSVVLISNTHIHIFKNFQGRDFFGGQHTQLNIAGVWTQKEGVSFSSNNEIYLTDENTGSGNNLYFVDLSNWIPPVQTTTTSIETINDVASASVYPVPANQYVNVALKNVNSGNCSFVLYDLTGKIIYKDKIENPLSPFTIPTADFPAGVYFYKVFSETREIQTSRLIISH
jgi:hypothetical protein